MHNSIVLKLEKWLPLRVRVMILYACIKIKNIIFLNDICPRQNFVCADPLISKFIFSHV